MILLILCALIMIAASALGFVLGFAYGVTAGEFHRKKEDIDLWGLGP